MAKISVVLLSKTNGTQTFTKDCLIEFAAKNKTIQVQQFGEITNIRYEAETEKVVGDIELTVRAAVNGYILSSLATTNGEIIITEFRPKDAKIFIGKPNE